MRVGILGGGRWGQALARLVMAADNVDGQPESDNAGFRYALIDAVLGEMKAKWPAWLTIARMAILMRPGALFSCRLTSQTGLFVRQLISPQSCASRHPHQYELHPGAAQSWSSRQTVWPMALRCAVGPASRALGTARESVEIRISHANCIMPSLMSDCSPPSFSASARHSALKMLVWFPVTMCHRHSCPPYWRTIPAPP